MVRYLIIIFFCSYLVVGCMNNSNQEGNKIENFIYLKLDSVTFKIGDIDTSLKLLNSDKLIYDQLTVFSDSCYNSQHYNYYFSDDSICENYSFNFIGDSLAEIQINILLSSIPNHRFILNDTIDLLKEKNYANISHNLVQVRDTTIHNKDYRVYNIKATRLENYNCWYKFNCN